MYRPYVVVKVKVVYIDVCIYVYMCICAYIVYIKSTY